MNKRLIGFIATGAAAIGVIGTGASMASAATPGCTSTGALVGYCASQTDKDATPLSFNAYHNLYSSGNKVIAYTAGNNSGNDWAAIAYAGNGNNEKMFIADPNGNIAAGKGLCISEPSVHAGLQERPCNGSAWQRWLALDSGDGTFFSWQNVQTGDIISATGKSNQLEGVTAPATLTPGEQWLFDAS